MKIARRASDVPAYPHWAIIEFGLIFIPGDERSRTNPGHGYPATQEDTASYTVFTDYMEFEDRLTVLSQRGNVVGIHVDKKLAISQVVTVAPANSV